MTTKLKGFFEKSLFLLLIFFAIIFAVRADTSKVVLDAISLWAATVLPATFPYLFITTALSGLKVTGRIAGKLSPLTKRLFNTGGLTGYAFFMSVISGYPVGAEIVGDLRSKGLLGDAEATRAAAFCSTSSPMFLIGCVGNIMFGSSMFGLFLWLCNLLSAIAVGIIFSFYKRNEKPSTAALPLTAHGFDDLIGDCAYSSALSIIKVGGIITVFYLLTETLASIGALKPFEALLSLLFGDATAAKAMTFGVFECTKGLKTLASGGLTALSLPLCAFTCGFGGLSVISQSVSCLKKAKIKTAPFFLAKVLMAVLSVIFAIIFNFFLL